MSRSFSALVSAIVLFFSGTAFCQYGVWGNTYLGDGFGQITSPNFGSAVTAGSDETITWNVPVDSTAILLLQYSTDNGYSWNYLGSSGVSALSYTWHVPVGINSWNCIVRIQAYDWKSRGYLTVARSGSFSIRPLTPNYSGLEIYSHSALPANSTN